MAVAKLDTMIRNEKGYKVRRQGFVPGVVYGKEVESTPVQFKKRDIEQVLRTHGERARLKVSVNEKEHLGIIKEVARDIITQDLIHLDIQLVSLTEEINLDVPFVFTGTDTLIPKGLVLHTYLNEIQLIGTVDRIPSSIEIDVTGKEDGDHIVLNDIDLPEGVTCLEPGDTPIAAVAIPKVEEIEEDLDEEEEVDAADVEVIGEEEEDDEEDTKTEE